MVLVISINLPGCEDEPLPAVAMPADTTAADEVMAAVVAAEASVDAMSEDVAALKREVEESK